MMAELCNCKVQVSVKMDLDPTLFGGPGESFTTEQEVSCCKAAGHEGPHWGTLEDRGLCGFVVNGQYLYWPQERPVLQFKTTGTLSEQVSRVLQENAHLRERNLELEKELKELSELCRGFQQEDD